MDVEDDSEGRPIIYEGINDWWKTIQTETDLQQLSIHIHIHIHILRLPCPEATKARDQIISSDCVR